MLLWNYSRRVTGCVKSQWGSVSSVYSCIRMGLFTSEPVTVDRLHVCCMVVCLGRSVSQCMPWHAECCK